MKEYARKFYSSKAWQRTRAAYAKSKRNLCEVCLDKGLYKPCEIVHHKVELTPDNIDNPDVTLNWNNLQCLCREHHAEVHDRANGHHNDRGNAHRQNRQQNPLFRSNIRKTALFFLHGEAQKQKESTFIKAESEI